MSRYEADQIMAGHEAAFQERDRQQRALGNWDYMNAQQFFDSTRPGYTAAYDPKSMSVAGMGLGPELQKRLAAIQMDSRGLNKFRDEALRDGPSAWAGLATNQQHLRDATARDRAMREVMGGNAAARGQLARQGGLSSGARERIARSGARNYMDVSQDIGRQSDTNLLSIGMEDERNRINQLGQLPGMEIAALQPELEKTKLWGQGKQFDVGLKQWDIGNQLQENRDKNNFNMQQWKEAAGLFGSEKTAQAMEKAGGSCWIISGLSRFSKLPMDQGGLLTRFKAFMGNAHPRESLFYMAECKRLVTAMDEEGFDWKKLESFNSSLVDLLRAGELDAAYRLFQAKLVELLDDYWPQAFDEYRIARRMKKAREQARQKMAEIKAKPGFDGQCLKNLGPECFQPA